MCWRMGWVCVVAILRVATRFVSGQVLHQHRERRAIAVPDRKGRTRQTAALHAPLGIGKRELGHVLSQINRNSRSMHVRLPSRSRLLKIYTFSLTQKSVNVRTR